MERERERDEGGEVEDCGAPSVCKQGLSDGTSSVDSAETASSCSLYRSEH